MDVWQILMDAGMVIGNYRTASGGTHYSITWLDTGTQTCGFTSKESAERWALQYTARHFPELMEGVK